MHKNNSNKRTSVYRLTIVGMLSAVSIVLGLTGYGYIPFFTAKLTIMHIPVIIGAILEGPKVGLLLGFIFGVTSLIQNMIYVNLLSFAFLNPLVSIFPRVFVGLMAYYIYKLMRTKSESLNIAVATTAATVTNTFGVLTMIYIIYAKDVVAAKGISSGTAASFIYGIALTNGIPEAIVAILICVPVIMALKKMR